MTVTHSCTFALKNIEEVMCMQGLCGDWLALS